MNTFNSLCLHILRFIHEEKYLNITVYIIHENKIAMFSIWLQYILAKKYYIQENTSKNKDMEVKSKIKFQITGEFVKSLSAIYYLKFMH